MVQPTDTEPGEVLRRAPFSDNPQVGARGLRTQQRLQDAALSEFARRGYHAVSIDAIARSAGCSRVSFYQYFSSKEDLFRHLAVQVARQLNASTDLLEPITAGPEGWASIRAWVGRFTDIHDRYHPIFRTFRDATESDELLADDSVRTAHRYIVGIQSRVTGSDLPIRELDDVIGLLREAVIRLLTDIATFEAATPGRFTRDRVLDAFTDVTHRSLFGIRPEVNVNLRRRRRFPPLPFGPMMQNDAVNHDADDGRSASPSRALLVDAAREVFVARGYHATRVDDIADAAGVSHGAFYRHFKNKDELTQLLAADAMRAMATTLVQIPEVDTNGEPDRPALRRWLRAYNRAHADQMAIIAVWADATRDDHGVIEDSAAVLDWGRRRVARFLEPRGFGDPGTDAVVLVSIIEVFGARDRTPAAVDAAARIIERGLLGR